MEYIFRDKLEELDKIIGNLEALTTDIDNSEFSETVKQLYVEMLGQMYNDRKDLISKIESTIKEKYKPNRYRRVK